MAIFRCVRIMLLLPVLGLGAGLARNFVNAQDWSVFARIMGMGKGGYGASMLSGRALEF